MDQPRESTSNPSDLREAAVSIVRRLVDAGHTAYFAGGCVRDKLLGIVPDDYDVATSAKPDEIRSLFRRAQAVGESFGVMLVRVRGHAIQVATFRTEGVYSDGRHPDSVAFSDAEHDAQRRDFTINGLFEDPLENRIIDYVGGEADLKAKLVRAIGDAHARLREDRLRMLRAVRFAARFGFAIETETGTAIRESAGDLKGVSRERVGQEVKRMLSHPNRAVAAWEIQYLGLDEATLLEPHMTVAPTRLGRLHDDAAYPTALAAWLLDRHELTGEDLDDRAAHWAHALVLSNAEQSALRHCLHTYLTLRGSWSGLRVAGQKRLAASPAFDEALMILSGIDRPAFIDVRRRVLDLGRSGLAPQPLVDGDDLIRAGLKPGPSFKRVLDGVYDAQLEGLVTSKEQAMALASELAAREDGR